MTRMFVNFEHAEDILFSRPEHAQPASEQEWAYARNALKDEKDGKKLSCYKTTLENAQSIPLSPNFILSGYDENGNKTVSAISHDKKRLIPYGNKKDEEAKNITAQEWKFAKKNLKGKPLYTKLRAKQKEFVEVEDPTTKKKFLLHHHF